MYFRLSSINISTMVIILHLFNIYRIFNVSLLKKCMHTYLVLSFWQMLKLFEVYSSWDVTWTTCTHREHKKVIDLKWDMKRLQLGPLIKWITYTCYIIFAYTGVSDCSIKTETMEEFDATVPGKIQTILKDINEPVKEVQKTTLRGKFMVKCKAGTICLQSRFHSHDGFETGQIHLFW